MLVGTYPHRGEAEQTEALPADVLALSNGAQEGRGGNNAPQALHVYRAKRKLRQLQPSLGFGTLVLCVCLLLRWLCSGLPGCCRCLVPVCFLLTR